MLYLYDMGFTDTLNVSAVQKKIAGMREYVRDEASERPEAKDET